MNLITPDFGLIFWQVIIFIILLWVLKRFAWKPILSTLKDRETTIEEALQSAEKARQEIAHLHTNNQKLLEEAKVERDKLIKEAMITKKNIIEQAKEEAEQAGNKIIEKAKVAIAHEKEMAMMTLKNQVAILSTQIAEKLLKKNLSTDKAQEQLVTQLIKEADLR